MKEYAAYTGQKFTIEWYFAANGESQALSFFNNCSAAEQQKFFHLVNYLKRIKEGSYYDSDYI
ncbi:hypothetical protein V1L52_07600 [Treponema sp. HNW]|uniref:hypothetical protein n=1 Tax=Treponema sp. HNW TaxID=3116654 RepID=UPI003D0AF5BA